MKLMIEFQCGAANRSSIAMWNVRINLYQTCLINLIIGIYYKELYISQKQENVYVQNYVLVTADSLVLRCFLIGIFF